VLAVSSYSVLWLWKFKSRSQYHISLNRKPTQSLIYTESFYRKKDLKVFLSSYIFIICFNQKKMCRQQKINTLVMMIQKYFGNGLKIFRENIES